LTSRVYKQELASFQFFYQQEVQLSQRDRAMRYVTVEIFNVIASGTIQ